MYRILLTQLPYFSSTSTNPEPKLNKRDNGLTQIQLLLNVHKRCSEGVSVSLNILWTWVVLGRKLL